MEMFILAVNHFDKGVFYSTGYFSVIRCPVFDVLQHFIEPKFVFGTHKVVTKHDEVHFSIYFLQSFQQSVGVAPMAFDASEGMLAYGLPSFVILRVLFYVIVICIYCILVLTSLNDA